MTIAAPVKSMGAAKSTGTTEEPKTDYTAADYIQDGLIAIWDAKDNAGFGEHDPYSFTVVNLADTAVADIVLPPDRWDIADNSIIATTNRGIIVSYPSQTWYEEVMMGGDGWTAEIVCNAKTKVSASANNNILSIAQACGFRWLGYSKNDLFNFDASNQFNGVGTKGDRTDFYAYDPRLSLHSFSEVVSLGQFTKMRIDDKMRMISKGGLTGTQYYWASRNKISIGCTFEGDSNLSQGKGWEWGCVRIYNRALTTEEVDHNYMVDKMRFGL
jgi:hypothetical protein